MLTAISARRSFHGIYSMSDISGHLSYGIYVATETYWTATKGESFTGTFTVTPGSGWPP